MSERYVSESLVHRNIPPAAAGDDAASDKEKEKKDKAAKQRAFASGFGKILALCVTSIVLMHFTDQHGMYVYVCMYMYERIIHHMDVYVSL